MKTHSGQLDGMSQMRSIAVVTWLVVAVFLVCDRAAAEEPPIPITVVAVEPAIDLRAYEIDPDLHLPCRIRPCPRRARPSTRAALSAPDS